MRASTRSSPNAPALAAPNRRTLLWRLVGTAAVLAGCSDLSTSPSAARAAPVSAAPRAVLPSYAVFDLEGALRASGFDGAFSIAFDIDRAGRVSGAATVAGGQQHGFLWNRVRVTDVGTLGGPNSQAAGRSDKTELAVLAEQAGADPMAEDFCLFHTGNICRAAVWYRGVLTALPTLGGNNAAAYEIDNRGESVGVAENGMLDRTCIAPQKSRFEATLWTAEGEIHELRPLPGDDVGFALRNNDRGQVVGSSGLCSNTTPSGLALGPHAVLWEGGSPILLGTLGGPHADVGVAADINNRGEVIGASGSTVGTIHPFLWTRASGMRDLGLLSTGVADAGNTPFEINDRGQIVGASCDIELVVCRAYLWQDGAMRDLNELVSPNSPLYLVLPLGINDNGDIVGLAVVKSTGEPRAFIAIPKPGRAFGRALLPRREIVRRWPLAPSVRQLLDRKLRVARP